MPTTRAGPSKTAPAKRRRTTGPAGGAALAPGQSTLSFRSSKSAAVDRVSKPSTFTEANKPGKSIATSKDAALLDQVEIAPPEPHVEDEDEVTSPVVEEQAVEEEEEEEEHEAFAAARRVTQTRLRQYWSAKTAARLAPRVHQRDLSLGEKVLREFDMTGSYGPCIGISRLKRWQRAHDLGLNPPIEVLAVLVQERDHAKGKSAQSLNPPESPQPLSPRKSPRKGAAAAASPKKGAAATAAAAAPKKGVAQGAKKTQDMERSIVDELLLSSKLKEPVEV